MGRARIGKKKRQSYSLQTDNSHYWQNSPEWQNSPVTIQQKEQKSNNLNNARKI